MEISDKSFHQLGKFIFRFQIIESQIEELIVLLNEADDEMVRIMINQLDFSQKLKTIDVVFARFVQVRGKLNQSEINQFHQLVSKTFKLAERRNELVHSRYLSWLNIEGRIGLLRKNAKLRASKGAREEYEEELMPESFEKDFEKLNEVTNKLEEYRLKIINWLYPDVTF